MMCKIFDLLFPDYEEPESSSSEIIYVTEETPDIDGDDGDW